MIKLALLDSNNLFRDSLSALLNKSDEIEITIEAENSEELLELLPKNPTDIILMDIMLPQMDGFKTCSIIRSKYPNTKVIILSDLNSNQTIQNIMQHDVQGIFSKRTDSKELLHAILNSEDTELILEKKINDNLIKSFLINEKTKNNSNNTIPSISSREVNVIKLICKQQTTTQIADQLCLAPATINTYRKRVLAKTNSINFIGVVIFMLKNGLLLIEDF